MGLKAIWNGWQRNLICMWASQLLVNIGFAAAFSFIPLYLASAKFGFSEAEVGAKASEAMVGFWTSRFSFYGMLAYAIFTPIWGMLSDRFGVKIMLYRGSFVTALIYPLMGLATGVNTLIILRFLTGALSGTTVAAKMLLVKTVPNDRQGFSLGVLETAIWGGAMIGDVLGGMMTHFFGFTVTFFLCGALFFISGLFVIFARDSEKTLAVAPAAAPGSRTGFRAKLAGMGWLFVPPILTMMLLFLLCGVALRFNAPYTSMMVKSLVGKEKAAFWTGIIGACAAGGGMLMGVLMGWLSDKFPEWKITTPVQLASSLMLFLASGATSLFGFGFCHAANSTVTGGLYAVFQKVTSGLVPRSRRGAVLGFATTMYNLGYMLSTLVSGWIVTAFGLRWVYRGASWLMVVLTVFSALAIFGALRFRKRNGDKEIQTT